MVRSARHTSSNVCALRCAVPALQGAKFGAAKPAKKEKEGKSKKSKKKADTDSLFAALGELSDAINASMPVSVHIV